MDRTFYLFCSIIIYLILLFGIGNIFVNQYTDVVSATATFWGFVLLGYVQITISNKKD